MNKLYYGDNLEIMRSMPKGCVDLIYLDPPFNSKRNYNLMYKTMTGKPVSEQVEAFCDRYEKNLEFVTPKRAREDGKGNADTGTTVFISDGHKEKAKEAISKFLE